MRSATSFLPSFGILAGLGRVGLGALLGLVPSCALDDSLDDSAASDPTNSAQSALTVGDESVCTKGKYRCHARVKGIGDRRIRPHALLPTGFGPPELQAAYKILPDKIVGTKPTVAIVDAYGYAALESDLGVYRAFYKLPPCTVANGCLKIVNQRGQLAPLPGEPPPDDDWTIETALDADMVSAACPLCNILVVQADDTGAGLFLAQDAAEMLGATVISNSWGGPEQPGTPPGDLAQTEAFFQRPGIAIFVSAGDDGYNDGGNGPDYPGTSAGVIAVGGTHLVKDPTSPRGWSETAWVKGGSACSLGVAKPGYQTTSPCGFKATTDIAAVGDPQTGMAVYNAANSGWVVVGGTSAAAPFVAAIFAATGNGAQVSGPFLAANTAKLHDVTVGSNGTCTSEGDLLCNAGVGWDGPTGYGTPNYTALGNIVVAPPGTGSGTGSGSDKPAVTPGDVNGGCSTGRNAGAGGLLGLALLGLRRRRR